MSAFHLCTGGRKPLKTLHHGYACDRMAVIPIGKHFQTGHWSLRDVVMLCLMLINMLKAFRKPSI